LARPLTYIWTRIGELVPGSVAYLWR